MEDGLLTFAIYPSVTVPSSVLRQYIEGYNPTAGKLLIQVVVDALTNP
jgi:hypothetical protein